MIKHHFQSDRFNRCRLDWLGLGVLVLFVIVPPVLAQSVQVQMSSREAYVGVPIMLYVQIENASENVQPNIPQVDGLRIESRGTPSVSSQTIIINNHVTRTQSITYAYAITPTREGRFTIPPLRFDVNGKTLQTREQTFTATKSETGDLLDVQVLTRGPTGYVGEAVDVLLRIHIKPFHDRSFEITLNETQMWNMVALNQSQWGIFRESLEKMYQQRRQPTGRSVYIENDFGERVLYYQYDIPATLWPRRPGRLDVGDVLVVVNYPTGLAQARGVFSRPGELAIAGQRPITASAEVESVQIKPVPEEGRPKDFTGSVGRYQMRAEAQPREVHVGDPIRLSLLVQGDGDLSFLHAPPLAKLEMLTRDFNVPNEPLPGIVQDDYKLFSVNIRPRREDVTEIPAIPLHYFNPRTETFETAWTEPIPIKVKPMDRMSLDRIVSSYDPAQTRDASARSRQSGQFPGNIYRVTEGAQTQLLHANPVRFSWFLWTGVVLPPVIVLGMFSVTQVRKRLDASPFMQQRDARKQAYSAIEKAEDAGALIRAMTSYIAHCAPRQTAGMTAQEACRLLEQAHVASDHVETCRSFFAACEQRRYLGADHKQLKPLKEEAWQWIASTDLSQIRTAPPTSLKHHKFGIWLMSVVLVGLWLGADVTQIQADALELTQAQQQELLQEAEQAYTYALELLAKQDGQTSEARSDARDAFRAAAERYQLLLDSGLENGHLRYNAANSYLQAGDLGRAIANYQLARAALGDLPQIRSELVYTRALRDGHPEPMRAARTSSTWQQTLTHWNNYVPLNLRIQLAMVSWWVVWLAVGIALYRRRMHAVMLRRVLIPAVIVLCLLSISVGYDLWQLQPTHEGVIVGHDVMMREGSGEVFGLVGTQPLKPGEELKILREQTGWFYVQSSDGREGWVPRGAIELVVSRT